MPRGCSCNWHSVTNDDYNDPPPKDKKTGSGLCKIKIRMGEVKKGEQWVDLDEKRIIVDIRNIYTIFTLNKNIISNNMSVKTTADEKRREATEHIDQAYKCLLELLDPNTRGHSEYEAEYIDDMHKALIELLSLKRRV